MRRTRIWRTGALFVAVAAAGVLWGTAAQASRAPAATHPVETHPAKKQPGAITVHGRWVITVRNKHGKIVQRRRFENELKQGGAQVLVDALAGTPVDPSTWTVDLVEPSDETPGANGSYLTLAADPAGLAPQGGRLALGTLALSTKSVDDGGPALVLNGQLTWPSTETYPLTIAIVRTEVRVDFPFTERVLDSRVTVQPGQSVSATVTITFAYSN